ncbi:unnamed protein product [Prunus armeniaca]
MENAYVFTAMGKKIGIVEVKKKDVADVTIRKKRAAVSLNLDAANKVGLKNVLGLPKRETCVKLPLESEFKDQAPRVFRKEISEVRDKACSPDVCLWKERKKMEAWVSLADFQQLDESFVRLLGGLTEEKNGSNGRTRLEIEGF